MILSTSIRYKENFPFVHNLGNFINYMYEHYGLGWRGINPPTDTQTHQRGWLPGVCKDHRLGAGQWHGHGH